MGVNMKEEKRNRLRRSHVQHYRAGFAGFCPDCAAMLLQSNLRAHLDACSEAKYGKKRRLVLYEEEAWKMRVQTITGSFVMTNAQGWTRRPMMGDVYYTKKVHTGDGGLAVITGWEAARIGVEGAGKTPEPTVWRTSSFAPTTRSAPRVDRVEAPKPQPKPKAKVLDLSEYELGKQLSKEAKRLAAGKSDPADRREALRRKHVAKHGKSNRSTTK